eukprot:15434937-Alexandrium_andersonii.AAC.1
MGPMYRKPTDLLPVADRHESLIVARSFLMLDCRHGISVLSRPRWGGWCKRSVAMAARGQGSVEREEYLWAGGTTA